MDAWADDIKKVEILSLKKEDILIRCLIIEFYTLYMVSFSMILTKIKLFFSF